MQTPLLDNLTTQYQIGGPCFYSQSNHMESPATHFTNHSGEEGSSSPTMPHQKDAAQKSRFFQDIDEALDSDSSATSLSPPPFMHPDAEMHFKAECPSPHPCPMRTTPSDS